MSVIALVGTEDGSSAASARTWLLKVLRMAQAPRWLKINDGSRSMMAQEPYTGSQKPARALVLKVMAQADGGSRNMVAQAHGGSSTAQQTHDKVPD